MTALMDLWSNTLLLPTEQSLSPSTVSPFVATRDDSVKGAVVSNLIWLNNDWLFPLLSNLLDLGDLAVLDMAISNPAERKLWHSCLQQVESRFLDDWLHCHHSIRWLLKRKLRPTEIRILAGSRHQITSSTFQGADMPSLTSIDLSGCINLGDTGIEAILNCCLDQACRPSIDDDIVIGVESKGCRQLRNLNLTSCDISDIGLVAISRGCPNLISITLSDAKDGIGITDGGLESFAEGCSLLEYLDLVNLTTVTDVGISGLASFCTQLKRIRLSGAKTVTNMSLHALIAWCPNIVEINLESSAQISDAAIADLAWAYPSLTHFALVNCGRLTNVAVLAILQNCESLVSIELKDLKNISNSSIERIGQRCPKLEHLELTALGEILDSGLQSIAQGCKEIRTLIIKKAPRITEVGVTAMALSCSHLHKIEIIDCHLVGDAGFTALALGSPDLETYILRCPGVTDQTLMAIAQSCPKLRFVNLPGTITDVGFVPLVDGCASLITIEVSHCLHITDVSLMVLGNGCKFLQSISLHFCEKITDDGVAAFMGCPNLRQIDLSCCSRITDTSLIALAHFCQLLDTVILSCCHNITDNAISAFATKGRLQTLDLYSCDNITDLSLVSLAQLCTNLNSINIRFCPAITELGVATFQRARPDVRIRIENLPYDKPNAAQLLRSCLGCCAVARRVPI